METDHLLNTIEAADLNNLQMFYGIESSLEQVITFNYANLDGRYKFDPEEKSDFEELLGKSLTNLNLAQISCLLGDEDVAQSILDYINKESANLGTKKILNEFMGKVWGDGNTLLHLASFYGMANLVRSLISYGAKIHKMNGRGYKPVDCANDDKTRLLFQQCRLNPIKQLDIMKISTATLLNIENDKIIKKDKMIKSNINVKKRKVSFDFWSVIHDLFKEGDLEAIDQMLSIDHPSLDHPNQLLIRPLHLAAIKDDRESIDYIVKYQKQNNFHLEIDPIDLQGWTPLHFAAAEGKFDCVKCLLDLGADPSILNHDGENVFDVSESVLIKELFKL